MSKRPFGEIGFSASSGVKLNANSSVVTDAFGDITTTPQGVAGQVLTSNGTTASPSYTNINVNAAEITGIVPIINGGTSVGSATGTVGSPVVLQASPTITSPTLVTPAITNLPNNGSIGAPNIVPVLVDVNSGNVSASAKTGAGYPVFSTGPIITTPTIDCASSSTGTKMINSVTDTTPSSVVVLDSSGNVGNASVTGSGSILLNTSPLIHSPSFDALPLTSAPTLALVQAGSNSVQYSTLNGTGNIVATTGPSLVTPNIGVASGTSLTVGHATISTSGTAEASTTYSNTGNTWTTGIDTLSRVLGYFDWVYGSNLMATLSPTGQFSAVLIAPSNVTPSTLAGFDSSRNLITAAQSGTGSTVVTTQGPTINNLNLTGTTSSTGQISTSNHLGVLTTGNNEASAFFENDTSNWIIGNAQGGNGTNFFFYNSGVQATLTPAGLFTSNYVNPSIGNNAIPYTNGSGVLTAVSGNLGVSGYVLTSQGPSTAPVWALAPTSTYNPSLLPTTTAYNTPGNYQYTPPTGCRYTRVTVVGGGGGGGNAISNGLASVNYNGAGGGSGATFQAWVLASWWPAYQNVTVGIGGRTLYTPGTATLTHNSNIVTGTGTAFLTAFVPGASIVFAVPGFASTIASVLSDTQLTMTVTYTGTTQTHVYAIIPQGTVTTSGSNSNVVGSGTTFTTSIALGGGWITIGPGLQQLLVDHVVDDTHLVLASQPTGSAVGSGLAWGIASQPGGDSYVRVNTGSQFTLTGGGGTAADGQNLSDPTWVSPGIGGIGRPNPSNYPATKLISPSTTYGNNGQLAMYGTYQYVTGYPPAYGGSGGASSLGGVGGTFVSLSGAQTFIPSRTGSGGAGGVALPYSDYGYNGAWGGEGYVLIEEFYN